MKGFSELRDLAAVLWVRRLSSLYAACSLNILREVCEYLKPFASLAFFSGSMLEVCYLPSFRRKQVPVSEGIVGCIITHTSSAEILCVGTYPTSTAVSSVNLHTFKIKKEAPMRISRNCPGVVRVKDFVYVFGGYAGGPITTASEKFSIARRSWTQLPNMDAPRVYFSPAVHESDIYLCDTVSVGTSLSCFSTQTETYRVVSLNLPNMQANASVAFIVHGELFAAMHPHEVIRWKLGASVPFVVVRSSNCPLQGFSCTEVVCLDKKVYWTDYNAKKVVQFDLKTLDYYYSAAFR